jgi:hypothetical protein
MLSTQESVSIYNQGLGHPDAGYRARRQAIQLFCRVYFQGQRRRLWNNLVRGENYLRELSEALQDMPVKSRHVAGLQNVTIAKIHGSEGRSQDFDAAFRPTHNRTQERWVSIATAQKLDVALPPVELIQVGDVYYVRDGHHRISVAKALGQMVIEAEVTVWEI